MRSVRQLSAQLTRYTRQLPVWAAPLLVVLVIAASSSVMWQTQRRATAATEFLWAGRRFTDSELGPILKALNKAKLSGYAVIDRRLRVPRGQASRYLAALAEGQALPRDFQSHTDAALSESSWFESERQRQRRLEHAQEKDLALAIGAMHGIENAMVRYDIAESHGFQAGRVMTACVAVLPAEGHVLDRQRIQAIRCLVAAAKAGLDPLQVAVTDLRSDRTWVGDVTNSPLLPRAEELLDLKKKVEQYWQHKLLGVVSEIPAAQVTVSVELSDDEERSAARSIFEPVRMTILVGVPTSHLVNLIQARTHPATTRGFAAPSPQDLRIVLDQVQGRLRDAMTAIVPAHIDMASAVKVTRLDDLPAVATRPWWTKWIDLHDGARPHVLVMAVTLFVAVIVWPVVYVVRRRRPSVEELRTLPIQDYQAATARRDATGAAQSAELDEQALRATLTEVVREDPDGAARILNRWIDRAG